MPQQFYQSLLCCTSTLTGWLLKKNNMDAEEARRRRRADNERARRANETDEQRRRRLEANSERQRRRRQNDVAANFQAGHPLPAPAFPVPIQGHWNSVALAPPVIPGNLPFGMFPIHPFSVPRLQRVPPPVQLLPADHFLRRPLATRTVQNVEDSMANFRPFAASSLSRRRTATAAALDSPPVPRTIPSSNVMNMTDPAAYIAFLTGGNRRSMAYNNHYIQRLSSPERQERQERNTLGHFAARIQEDKEARAARLRQDAAGHSQARSQENEEETAARRLENAERNRDARSQESEEETAARRLENAERNRDARSQENEEETAARRFENAERNRDARRRETEEEMAARLAQEAARRREARAVRRNAIPDLPAALSNVPPAPHYLGPMIHQCTACKALYFKDEAAPRVNAGEQTRTYNPCCNHGRLEVLLFTQDNNITVLFADYPDEMKRLLLDDDDFAKNFKDTVRSFNSALAMASLDCQLKVPLGRGPPVFRVHGAIQHHVGPATPSPGNPPRYAQLYFVDTAEANLHRMGQRSNRKCRPETMSMLGDLLSRVNPWAQQYKRMGDVYREEEAKARANNTEMPRMKLVFQENRNRDMRRYNAPTSNEIAAVFLDSDEPTHREYTVHLRGGGISKLSVTNELDPFVYPIFFPTGKEGWHENLNARNRRVTMPEFYSYLLSLRPDFNPLHHGGKLFQQFLVDVWIRVESNRLKYFQHNQPALRAEMYQNLQQFVADGEDGLAGTHVILPPSHVGSPRFYSRCYSDTMAMVTRFGKPDLFLTMTSNPEWIEVRENLYQNQQPCDRPDLITRIFNLKLQELLHDITVTKIFGGVAALVWVVEFQKRGLPHVHMLITLKAASKLDTVEKVDNLISAELPDRQEDPRLFDLVTKMMLHRKCGSTHPNAPCMRDGRCTKKFPKPFVAATNLERNAYPDYRRRDDGRTFTDDGIIYTNQHVVPFSKYLLKKYGCHINLEVCSLLHAVKYLYKYVYKGSDKAEIELRRERREANGGAIDEIMEHVDGRYVCPPEAIFRIFGYNIHGRSHSIEHLQVHLPDNQRVFFRAGQEAEAVQLNTNRNTSLTAFFALNEEFHQKELNGEELGPVDPRTLLYSEIPEHFVWKTGNGGAKWSPRQRTTKPKIGRLYGARPSDVERHSLRLLLLLRKGAVSFEDLRTVNGHLFDSFRDAAFDLGLIHNERHFETAMDDAVRFAMPRALRKLFVSLLACDGLSSAQAMWTKYKGELSEDHVHRGRTADEAEGLSFWEIADQLETANIELTRYIVPAPNRPAPDAADDLPDFSSIGQNLRDNLRPEQECVVSAIINGTTKLALIDGPGGSGKTYVYTCIYNVLKGLGKNVVCSAWTGIAANLLPEGRTLCSLFKLNPQDDCRSSTMAPNSKEGRDLKAVDVFIIDEVSMVASWTLESIDRLLKEVNNSQQQFGGRTVLLGGDFRQVLPIPPKGCGLRPSQCCLKYSQLFGQFTKFKLTENIRAEGEHVDWKEFLLAVGDGRVPEGQDGKIALPVDLMKRTSLIDDVYEGVYDLAEHLNERAILCAKKKSSRQMNSNLLDRMNTDEKTYYSMDRVDKSPDDPADYSDEFLHSLDPSGMAPHKLRLKIGAIVMLIRNINIRGGLCNGTRLQVSGFARNVVCCSYINGARKGEKVLIPRIELNSDKALGLKLIRRQFPLELAFCMTINKSQGQSLKKVGISLKEEVFGHGMLYVALSRSQTRSGISVETADGSPRIVNIVERAVLEDETT